MGRLSVPRARLTPAPRAGPGFIERETATKRGYVAAWDKASKAYRRRNPLCRGCQAVGRVEATTLTDHVIPHTHGTPRFWDEAWWQPSCKWHHDSVKQRLERMFDAGEIGADDLWLDSPIAIEIAARERVRGGGV